MGRGRYSIIDRRVWRDERVRQLDDTGKLCWLFVLSNPLIGSIPGLYCAGPGALAEEIDWPVKRLAGALGDLEEAGLLRYEAETRLLWVPRVATRYDAPRNPNQIRSWRTQLGELANSALLREALSYIRRHLQVASIALVEAFDAMLAEAGLSCFGNKTNLLPKQTESVSETNPSCLPNNRVFVSGSGSGSVSDHVPDPVDTADIRAVFDHYRSLHPLAHRKPHSKMPEWGKIRARLAEGYSAQDLCDAIDGCHRSPYHSGDNEAGRRYQSLELICRDGGKVLQFMEVPKGAPALSAKTRRTASAAARWAERPGGEK